jgi:biotin synthase-related radical SAM superfamily protein
MNYLNEVRDTSTEQRHSADHSVLQMFVEICESFLYMNILAFKIKVCHDYRKKRVQTTNVGEDAAKLELLYNGGGNINY